MKKRNQIERQSTDMKKEEKTKQKQLEYHLKNAVTSTARLVPLAD